MKMNTPTATKRAGGPSNDLHEQKETDRREITSKSGPGSLTDLPSRASTMTPLLSDMLERVQGVARWGLNE